MRAHRVLPFLFASFLTTTQAQTLTPPEVGPTFAGGSVEVTGALTPETLDSRFTTPIAHVESLAALKHRIDAAGDLRFVNATLTIGTPEGTNSGTRTLVAKHLQLANTIVTTNGSPLIIFAERISTDELSRIQSFGGDRMSAPSASQPGSNGRSGLPGGKVTIYLLNRVEGTLNIALLGQNGGKGADGVKGPTGAEGRPGRNARNGDFGTCRRGPGRGDRGAAGGKGGNGGSGGKGGDGGALAVTYVNVSKQVPLPVAYVGRQGDGGLPGAGGPGGDGGRGGIGGRNAGNCRPAEDRERNRGATGATGPVGNAGSRGPNGAEQSVIVQELTLPATAH